MKCDEMFKINQRKGCLNADRVIVASIELADRCNKWDPRIGVCLAKIDVNGKTYWNTWEYNAENPNNYYCGNYYMENEVGAWSDYFDRCNDLISFYKRYSDTYVELEA